MASDSSNTVNAQVVDAVNTTNTTVLGESTSMALGMLFQMEAQAFSMAMQNAVAGQRGMQQVGEAVIAAACARIMRSLDDNGGK
ncbi:RebB family R body protein [Pyxidicoccus parkwayensis]|uniref:RebB family R body protein n=1 Tax=Pyxidicoccus parkwayensis TaxID=2813578 RepID=A0ABX7NST9_9BACT|nr:RebB family R body protein [Pyxidicoccus parkwaysis]QSQ21959.1 RebB family R body protein [Pyxidicoccus parkwaysis]